MGNYYPACIPWFLLFVFPYSMTMFGLEESLREENRKKKWKKKKVKEKKSEREIENKFKVNKLFLCVTLYSFYLFYFFDIKIKWFAKI